MNIGTKIEKALNEQINQEFTAGYIYLGMAAWFDSTVFSGFAKWMHQQSKEEFAHAMKTYDYIYNRNGRVDLFPISKPECNFNSPLEVFEYGLKLERMTTENIYALYRLAEEEKDFTTKGFLDWFIKEQIEEEKSFSTLIDKLKICGDSMPVLFKLDAEASERSS